MQSQYEDCPCQSGKKLKWCCAALWPKVEQAITLLQKSQKEAGLRALTDLVAAEPTKPEPLFYLLQIYLQLEDETNAKATMEKLEKLAPNFPGLLLMKGSMAEDDRDLAAATAYYRQCLAQMPAEGKSARSRLYAMIARAEMMRNNLLASRAAMEKAVNLDPDDLQLRQQYDTVFGDKGTMPRVASKPYGFRKTAKPVTVATDKLDDAAKAYQTLTEQVPNDPAAWFNLALCLTWLGQMPQAKEALNKSIDLEYADVQAEESAALLEVLKLTETTDDSDYTNHFGTCVIRDAQAMMQWLRMSEQQGKFYQQNVDQENGIFTSRWVEALPNLIDTGTTLGKVLGQLSVGQGAVVFTSSSKATVETFFNNLRDQLQLGISDISIAQNLPNIRETLPEANLVPLAAATVDEAVAKLRTATSTVIENTWANKPLKALGGRTPTDAVADPQARKRLLGVVLFHESVFAAVMGEDKNFQLYDFDVLRSKLGLVKDTTSVAPAELQAAAKPDFGKMDIGELGALNVEQVSVQTLEEAMKAALKLEARELAVHFAKAAIAKPADSAKPDRYPLYLAVVSAAMSEQKYAEAISVVEAGLAYDAAHNDGKRANDFDSRRAQLLLKSGDLAKATTVFGELIDRNPNDARWTVTAIEAMLGAKQQAKAQEFVDKGVALAKSTGNRDLEAACKELAEAVKRMK
jgi:tetratricopeptide (TPR) repeat protein